jgi:hypothetical protein
MMSEIDFDMAMERRADRNGDRVKITMSGRFLSFKYYDATGNAQAYTGMRSRGTAVDPASGVVRYGRRSPSASCPGLDRASMSSVVLRQAKDVDANPPHAVQ